ncbi:MAG TPA: hypothetical protein VKI44_01340 [Acetobacteraceae bacterium]|nr:hypothetical protein [Acetobacteraceae bacterium]
MTDDADDTAAAGYDLFLAAPMSALDESDYATERAGVLAVVEQLGVLPGFARVYFAGAEIGHPGGFTGEADALRRDLTALRHARLFVLIYPGKIVTSALVEVGYALALRLPCLLLVRDRSDLPYLLNQAEQTDAGDLLPPMRIELLGEPAQSARQIAAFRDQLHLAAAP